MFLPQTYIFSENASAIIRANKNKRSHQLMPYWRKQLTLLWICTIIVIAGLDCDKSFERSKESDVLRVMTATLNVTISKQCDPVRFADAAYSAGFISEETKMDSLSSVRNDYGKVSKVMSAVKTHITQQSNYEVCRKFDRFILLLHGELKMKDLAKQLVDKLRELHGFK